MPTLSEEEMAALLDPALLNPVADDDEEEAVRSQLMANMEQNRRSFASNVTAEPFTKPLNLSNGDTTSNLPTPNKTQGEARHSVPDEVTATEIPVSAVTEDSDDSEDEEQASGSQRSDIRKNKSVGMEEEDSELVDASGVGADQEDEDFKSASSKLASVDMADTGSQHPEVDSEEEEEQEDASNGSDNSDEETDLCLFCNVEGPNEAVKEDDLSCTVCRRPAHAACARSQNAASEEQQSWRCPSCSENRTSESPKEVSSKARHSAPRLVRDLLPVSRGLQKPGAHSIFAQPLIPDDDGGRALRKRKSLSVEHVPRKDTKRKKMAVDTPKPEKADVDVVSHSTRRASQKFALGMAQVPVARVLQHRPFHKPAPHKFILAFRLDQAKIEAILAQPPRPGRRRYHEKKKQKIPAPPPYQPPVPKFPALPTHHLIFPSMFGDRDHDTNAKPYGGILSEVEAETSRSLPQMRDREIFENARKEAEEERKKTSAQAEAEMNGLNGEGGNATSSKRTVSGPPSKIKCIQFGKFVIDTSYAAPYPEEYSHESRLFICEFCLKYLPSEFVAWRHKLKCPAKHPPGDEIYRDGSLSIWEVDGRKKTEYCQCLCLMAKLFLGSKTLYYDVDPFLFYVLTEYDELGYHFVGYFSKEKRPASQNNVSCILVMPIHQRKGYATFLIEFSYLLTRIEGKEGSPEKPLSDMGLTAYRSYWDLTISRHLLDVGNKPFSVKDMMERTGMTADDVVHSLERLYAFIKDPVTKAYAIRYDQALYRDIVHKYESKQFRQINPERLVWTPYIMGRSDAANLDAQPITAVAQREGDVDAMKDSFESERISPKGSQEPSQASPSKPAIDPDLINEIGAVAPGPPPVTALNGIQPTATDISLEKVELANGIVDKGKENVEPSLSGYALTYRVEKIPSNRYLIDPPIPAAMLRKTSVRRKSAVGTPRANGIANGKATTPQPTRSSPRKAGSVSGSMLGQDSSRATSPDKAGTSVRRSGRKSGLANEIVTAEDDLIADHSDAESGSEDDGSEESEDEGTDDESNASNDPDAEILEEDEDEDEESQDGEEDEDADISSAVSSAVASGDEASESGEED